MSNQNILITGVSGHVGYRVLVEALSRGYHVRAVVRKAEQEKHIRSTASIQPLAANLEFVVVPDLLKDGAFDGILNGIHFVIHVASPLPQVTDNPKKDVIDPAINGTLGIMKSAAKVPSVKRMVITSSIAALKTPEHLMSNDKEKVLTAYDSAPLADINGSFTSPFDAYDASKSHALALSERFTDTEKPGYDLISLLPSVVIGKNELHTSKEQLLESINSAVMTPLIGCKCNAPTVGVTVHIDDVARAHVDALNPDVPGNKRLLISAGSIKWDDAKDIVRRRYPKQVADGTFTLEGSVMTKPRNFDSSEAERLFGWKFKGYEEQVVSVVDQYLELAAKASKM